MKLIKENIKIKATKGGRTIAKADSLFDYIDSDFVNWGCDKPSEDKEATEFKVLEQDKNGSYKELFGEISKDLDSMVLTQSQIIEFCKNHKDLLSNWYIRFLFKVGDEFFVAGVDVNSGGYLSAHVRRFSRGNVWSAEIRFRFVVPATATLSPSTLTPCLSETLFLCPHCGESIDVKIKIS